MLLPYYAQFTTDNSISAHAYLENMTTPLIPPSYCELIWTSDNKFLPTKSVRVNNGLR